ncbi:MAG: ABC transporter permease, partial [Candidatus Rokuibacteriota bacterium]
MHHALRYAVRAMLRSRRFVPLALVALALGIGANTAVFTVVNAVLLSPLPYEDADRMVALFRERPTGVSRGVSVPKYFAWRETASDVLADLSVYDGVSTALTLTVGGDPEQVNALRVSGDFFRLFRAQPMYGRFFTAEEDAPGGPRVVVLGHGLWTRRFGAN